jgi:hypothetical protein
MVSSGLDADEVPSAWEVAKRIYHQHGLTGLFRGLTVMALRDTGYGAYFVSVSIYRSFLLQSYVHSTKN